MSLVCCRYNKNHKVKASRLQMHEAKCPDRVNSKIKLMQCPYNPNHQIEEKDFANHKKNCPDKPNITEDEKRDMDEAVSKINIDEERKKIEEARKSYYKGCVNQNDDVEDYNSFVKDINLSNNKNNNSNSKSNNSNIKSYINSNFTRKYIEQKQYDPNDEDKDITPFVVNIIPYSLYKDNE